jgi:hypothetical protein
VRDAVTKAADHITEAVGQIRDSVKKALSGGTSHGGKADGGEGVAP